MKSRSRYLAHALPLKMKGKFMPNSKGKFISFSVKWRRRRRRRRSRRIFKEEDQTEEEGEEEGIGRTRR